MTDDTRKQDAAKPPRPCGDGDAGFPIRDLPDLRRLRKSYLTKDDKPIGLDSADNPRPDDTEEDFGLKRSTAEEAWQFYHDSVNCDDHDDELTEFLDDR